MSLEAACTNIILEIHPQAADSVSIWTWANFFLIIHFLAHVLNKDRNTMKPLLGRQIHERKVERCQDRDKFVNHRLVQIMPELG